MSGGKAEPGAGSPYLLKFETVLKETIWGGNRLEPLLGQGETTGRQIGEAWIAWDGLRVDNGRWRGRSLADVVKANPVMILGEEAASRYGEVFPLLVKLIDARENLSVQVHPDDLYALRYEAKPFGKSEMWYVLDAQPDASIIHGVKHRVDAREIAAAIEEVKLGELLETIPVKAGDVVYNSAGTVHALGKGLFIYELQQSSDITYRLYDWGRKQADGSSRELHVERSIEVMIPDPFGVHKIRPVDIPGSQFERWFLCACRYFVAERMRLRSAVAQSTGGRRFDILTVLEGGVEVLAAGAPEEPTRLSVGKSVVAPAGLGEYEVRPVGESAVLIKSYVPDLLRDVVIPLREQGVGDAEILQLGGDLAGNDLASVLRAAERAKGRGGDRERN